jgi:hypothetical protein
MTFQAREYCPKLTEGLAQQLAWTLRGDLDRNTNRETKLAVGAPLVYSDFNEPI